jgi:hypothetical protein
MNLGEVQRQIPFIHAGRERKFPVNSLFPAQNFQIWAEFGDFSIKFENFPVNFPVLVIRMELQVEIGYFIQDVGRGTHPPWKRSNPEAASALRSRYVPGRLDAIPVARALRCRSALRSPRTPDTHPA